MEDEQLLSAAREEIVNLRRANTEMAGQLEIVELFKAALLPKSGPQPCGIDIVHVINQRLHPRESVERQS